MEQERNFVERAKKGDVQAFAELYREIYRDLYRFALYTLRNSHDAEDAVSETVTDAWAQIAMLRRTESFRSWMFAILTNKCRRRLKQYTEKTQELLEELCADMRDAEEDADVRAAFARLEAEERMIISLRVFGGYSSREIAAQLGMNDNTVRSKYKRALEKMEAYLAG